MLFSENIDGCSSVYKPKCSVPTQSSWKKSAVSCERLSSLGLKLGLFGFVTLWCSWGFARFEFYVRGAPEKKYFQISLRRFVATQKIGKTVFFVFLSVSDLTPYLVHWTKIATSLWQKTMIYSLITYGKVANTLRKLVSYEKKLKCWTLFHLCYLVLFNYYHGYLVALSIVHRRICFS